MKTKIISASMVTVLGALMFSQSALATTYQDDLNATSPVTVLIEDEDSLVIPPIDPEGPPIIPIDPNPEPGALAIRYISSLDFGQVFVDGSEQMIRALPDVDTQGAEFSNLVSLRDVRSSTNRDGWTLTVKQDQELLEGSTITMNPYINDLVAERLEVSAGGEIILNSDAQVFARTNTNTNPSGSLSIGMAQPGESVALTIPEEEYEAGEYTTTLTWELISGPMAPS
ncbi:WxL domain-containing protein [Carnobacterium maltaromaticum]|uniref:WxL domain-containing protein n=1 Tax=Carnobacterium maltaromaticum TaxID=2751 RepID=UPI00295EE9B0|nr:WxL domain-containing protein [Carnobacterium maltaromaticum]